MFRSLVNRVGLSYVPLSRSLATISRPSVMASFSPISFNSATSSMINIPMKMSDSIPILQIQEPVCDSIEENEDNTMYLDSVLRKRRLKMKKHKLRKRRRAQRSLKKRLGKI